MRQGHDATGPPRRMHQNAIADTATGQIRFRDSPFPEREAPWGSVRCTDQDAGASMRVWESSFKIRESTNVQIRVDATNVLNHPEPNSPNLNINTANFGVINGKSTLTRELQGQLRISF